MLDTYVQAVLQAIRSYEQEVLASQYHSPLGQLIVGRLCSAHYPKAWLADLDRAIAYLQGLAIKLRSFYHANGLPYSVDNDPPLQVTLSTYYKVEITRGRGGWWATLTFGTQPIFGSSGPFASQGEALDCALIAYRNERGMLQKVMNNPRKDLTP